MVEIRIEYQGDLRTVAVHGPSGTRLITDPPVDNQGKGESFSPTDLLATATGTCMMTLMAMYARKHGVVMEGTRLRVEKHMAANPRRVARLVLEFDMPAGIRPEHREGLRQAAITCPVKLSIHPELESEPVFCYPD